MPKAVKNIVPAANLNRKGMRLPNTPPTIMTIGGAYGTDISSNPGLAKQYGQSTDYSHPGAYARNSKIGKKHKGVK